MNRVFVIGGANVDIYAKAINKLIPKDSNPSKISFSYGGVARNISCNLANLGAEVIFITGFGNDEFAQLLKNDLLKRNIDIAYSYNSITEGSSKYLAFLDENDMYIGASDMTVLNQLTPVYLSKLKDVINDDDYLVFDTNLEEKTIEYIAEELKGIKVVDTISANKAIKLFNVLDKIDILKMNLMEAEVINGKPLNSDADIKSFITRQVLKTKEVLVSKSKDLFVGSSKGIHQYRHYAYNESPENVTGAGDALLATYVYGVLKGYDINLRSKLAITAAIINVASKDAVAEMKEDSLHIKAKEIRIEEV